MGTILELSFVTKNESTANETASAVFSRVAQIEKIASNYLPDSEIEQFNRSAGSGLHAVSDELFAMLTAGQAMSKDSRGGFDLTIRPGLLLWQNAIEKNRWPTAHSIDAIKPLIDYRHLQLDSNNRKAGLTMPGMGIDLGGIAKGYALDEASRLLGPDIHGALFNFGRSSMLALGSSLHAPYWQIYLPARKIASGKTLRLRDQGFSVSETNPAKALIGNKSVGHLIDPKTGKSTTTEALSIVIATDALSAELLSTSLLLIEPNLARKLIEQRAHTEAYWTSPTGDTLSSTGWQEFTAENILPASE